MAMAIDDNAAYEKSDKSIWRLLNIHCTRPKNDRLGVSIWEKRKNKRKDLKIGRFI